LTPAWQRAKVPTDISSIDVFLQFADLARIQEKEKPHTRWSDVLVLQAVIGVAYIFVLAARVDGLPV